MSSWMTVTVQLLGGRGETFWPPPGRVIVVGPRHTFADLADAVNTAFGRWDLAHLSAFTLLDGTVVSDEDTLREQAEPDSAAAPGPDITTTALHGTVDPGDPFRYVFDLGDTWVHACTVGNEYVDPVEVLGVTPTQPRACFGWGTIPDQYGREEPDDLDELPPRPERHPMLSPTWPQPSAPPVDARELRAASRGGDSTAILEMAAAGDVSPALQQLGHALEVALQEDGGAKVRSLAEDVASSLDLRDQDGDRVLAQDLRALVQGQPLDGRQLAVDLDELAGELEGRQEEYTGYLDLHTGEVVPGVATDPGMVGEDAAVDVDEDPDRWLALDSLGSRDGWRDMAMFTDGVTDRRLRERLQSSLAGKGAFRRFKDAIHDADLASEWYAFSDDRQWGRARQFLADNGIRVLP